ncbi:MAG: nitrogen fixation protein NifZ [Oceanospirillaceae bacterium]|nr:nitrogen fixation protein NifZ [Oceanospirillaceae bacterium]MBT14331.1 nitrogen fixation protein NifZ [Oceanospirillaceae bacterium]|tara:strand:- start:548 stop:1042 length:495 start_codon:yes stop_codon:yes gene_type:complete
MKPAYEYGDEVRLIRNVRNDGTYPGTDVGELLMRRGATGCVYDVGTYLQDQLIYRVHFLEEGRTVGCREEELIPADAPWIANKYEFRDVVVAAVSMRSGDDEVVKPGDLGEIIKIIRTDDSLMYHARFNGRTFQVPEEALESAPEGSRRAAPLLLNGQHAGGSV